MKLNVCGDGEMMKYFNTDENPWDVTRDCYLWASVPRFHSHLQPHDMGKSRDPITLFCICSRDDVGAADR